MANTTKEMNCKFYCVFIIIFQFKEPHGLLATVLDSAELDRGVYTVSSLFNFFFNFFYLFYDSHRERERGAET